jgi:undecaprenyl pyrophosphate synthase
MSDQLKPLIRPDNVPRHIAIIMDGNGRWAKSKGMPRVLGHHSGVKSVREVTEAAAEIGVGYLTLYAFSTENWNRPPAEVTALMTLLVETIKGEIRDLNKNGVRLLAIGDIEALPQRVTGHWCRAWKIPATTPASTSCWRSTIRPNGKYSAHSAAGRASQKRTDFARKHQRSMPLRRH